MPLYTFTLRDGSGGPPALRRTSVDFGSCLAAVHSGEGHAYVVGFVEQSRGKPHLASYLGQWSMA
ncbi:MAG TPA: hypothetical protein VKW08_22840 [Xanthobacteraceae bacterium]|nr:hypothetical protein [Xanthobacteraceae bacterium]